MRLNFCTKATYKSEQTTS